MQKPKRSFTRFYYGWFIALALAITETISWGLIYYAFTVFITPMEHELGWSRAELTGGFSLALLISGALAFPVGAWIDRHGARFLMTIGSILACLLMVAWSQVTDVRMFYLIWAGLGVCAACVLYEPAFAVMATWFSRYRGRALTLITFAGGLASTIFVPLSDALLHAYGWRQAVLILGLFLGAVTIPLHALVLRRQPNDLGLLPDGDLQHEQSARPIMPSVTVREVLHSRFFWALIAAFTLGSLATSAVRVHFIPLLTGAGINASTAALASGAIGLMQVTGRLLFVPAGSRVSGRVMLIVLSGMQAAALAILMMSLSLPAVAVFVIIYGTSYGAQILARASLIAEWFGTAYYARISSIMSIFLTVAGTISPVIAATIYDHSGNYQIVLVTAVVLAIISTSLFALARPDVKKHLSD